MHSEVIVKYIQLNSIPQKKMETALSSYKYSLLFKYKCCLLFKGKILMWHSIALKNERKKSFYHQLHFSMFYFKEEKNLKL